MQSIYSFCLLIFLGVTQSDWTVFTDEEHLFSVLVPGEMQFREQYIETTAGDYLLQTVYTETALDSLENYLFLINYYRVQDDLFSADSSSLNIDFLQLTAADMANGMNGELLYTHPVHSQDWTSLEYRVQFQGDEFNMKGKMYLTPTHFFSLQVYSTRQYALNTQRDRFLNSFRLLESE
jgi:hypothetical protein